MTDHGVDVEELTIRVPVVAPGIDGSMGQDFDHLALGVVAPDAALDRNPLFLGRTGKTEVTGTGVTTATVKPASGPKRSPLAKLW